MDELGGRVSEPYGFKNSVGPPDSADLQRDRVNEPYAPPLAVFLVSGRVPTPRLICARRCHRDIFSKSAGLQDFCV